MRSFYHEINEESFSALMELGYRMKGSEPPQRHTDSLLAFTWTLTPVIGSLKAFQESVVEQVFFYHVVMKALEPVTPEVRTIPEVYAHLRKEFDNLLLVVQGRGDIDRALLFCTITHGQAIACSGTLPRHYLAA